MLKSWTKVNYQVYSSHICHIVWLPRSIFKIWKCLHCHGLVQVPLKAFRIMTPQFYYDDMGAGGGGLIPRKTFKADVTEPLLLDHWKYQANGWANHIILSFFFFKYWKYLEHIFQRLKIYSWSSARWGKDLTCIFPCSLAGFQEEIFFLKYGLTIK